MGVHNFAGFAHNWRNVHFITKVATLFAGLGIQILILRASILRSRAQFPKLCVKSAVRTLSLLTLLIPKQFDRLHLPLQCYPIQRMRKHLRIIALLVTATAILAIPFVSNARPETKPSAAAKAPKGVPKFEVDPTWPKSKPSNWQWG